jgi:ABC transporter substrate binding protein
LNLQHHHKRKTGRECAIVEARVRLPTVGDRWRRHTDDCAPSQTPDPVGAGFVNNLARPGGNATGFSIFDYSIGGKWLELLKQIAPGVTRVAVIRDPATPQGIGQFSAVHALAPSLGLEVSPINARELGELERNVTALANIPNSGMIVTGSTFAIAHREQHRGPLIWNSLCEPRAREPLLYAQTSSPAASVRLTCFSRGP